VAFDRGEMERHASLFVAGVGTGAAFEQGRTDFLEPVIGGEVERGFALVVGCVGIGLGPEQGADRTFIAIDGSEVEWRGQRYRVQRDGRLVALGE